LELSKEIETLTSENITLTELHKKNLAALIKDQEEQTLKTKTANDEEIEKLNKLLTDQITESKEKLLANEAELTS